ncbi:uncharacterized protein LOC132308388 isoform X2 [Cornus florida]|uniref:uncharacterized protein LOC132308388 isoform X2 n=1 Tax=Cornus florida TaxID=4283 RepID=UPI0028A241F4|nr:uncharacterized protein LOC132308388 isoform X2 [Cornus florida]
MEPTDEIGGTDPSEARSEGLAVLIGEKRPAKNREDNEFCVPSPKKARNGGQLVGTMKKVAEMVLVLASMGKMRAGRSPTAVEKEMMVEARGKLAEVCEGFAPKEVFPRDAFGAVIEDIGLNKLKEQMSGFRPPKVSISEKLLLTKQKMEKSEEFSLHSTASSSQRLQRNSDAAAESRGTSHTSRMFPSDKPSHPLISSGGFQPASPLAHVSAAKSTSLPYQLPASEIRSPVISSGLPSSHLGRDSLSLALPSVERVHFRLDGRSNGSSYTSQVQANSSGRTPTWSLQHQSATFDKIGPDNKVPAHTPVKFDGPTDLSASRVAPHVTASKPFISQTASGNLPSIHQHLQGMNFVQGPSLYNSHNEIGKIVQKLLQPQLAEQPTWTPPSRDYMNKALTCQVCKLIVNEVENVLLCDACDKGFHLKCLQIYNQKGIPRGEWHCQKCLTLSNGKPLPPKYGRVMRNMNAPKVSSDNPTIQSSPDNKVGFFDQQINQQKITANGNSNLQSATVTMGNKHNNSASDSNILNAREMQGDDVSSSRVIMDDKRGSGPCPNDVMNNLDGAHDSPAGSSLGRSFEVDTVSKSKPHPPVQLSEKVINSHDDSQASHNSQYNVQTELPNSADIPSEQCHDNGLMVKDTKNSCSTETFDCDSNCEMKQVARANSVEVSGSSIGAQKHVRSLADGLRAVDWTGDVLNVVDEKTYYQSCCVNGVVYQVRDHALFRSNDGKLMPHKIQAMWEDSKTRSKWVIANRCYFPGNLPKVVGHPFTPESNEVYESDHDSTTMAGLIQGPCEVLPPGKFVEESERRTRLGKGENNGLRPLFLCKWFYDESKGLFRDVSS